MRASLTAILSIVWVASMYQVHASAIRPLDTCSGTRLLQPNELRNTWGGSFSACIENVCNSPNTCVKIVGGWKSTTFHHHYQCGLWWEGDCSNFGKYICYEQGNWDSSNCTGLETNKSDTYVSICGI